MNIIAELTISALREHGTEDLPQYEKAFINVCSKHPPHFGMKWYGDKFRDMSSDPSWFVNFLISNAEKEGEGARRLWEMASRTGDPTIYEHIRKHAIDEARHAQYYISMLNLAFPLCTDEEAGTQLRTLSPGYGIHDYPQKDKPSAPKIILDELIQMNIGEIRTRINQMLLRPVIIAYCPFENRAKLTKLLDSLLLDETRHVEYTSRLINEAVFTGSGDFVWQVMQQRWSQFNDLTLQEVGVHIFN